MRNFKRFVAFVLCAVMLAGVMPVALYGPTTVVAEGEGASEVPTVENETTGVIQGENDAVVIYNVNTTAGGDYTENKDFRKFFGFIREKSIRSGSIDSVPIASGFNRIIFVITSDVSFGVTDLAFEYDDTYTMGDNDKIVITSKCYVAYEKNVYVYANENPNSLTAYADADPEKKIIPTGENEPVIDFKDDVKFSLPTKADGYVRIACAVTFSFITLEFKARTFINCFDHDFEITDSVVFTYDIAEGKEERDYYPIVVSGSGSAKYCSPLKEFTVTLNAGEYYYVAIRSRGTRRDRVDKTINLNLGKIIVHGGDGENNVTAFFGNDTYKDTILNVVINGTTFEGKVYLIGGSQYESKNAPDMSRNELNITVEKATFKEGLTTYKTDTVVDYIFGKYANNAKNYALKVNFIVKDITVPQGKTMELEADSFAYNDLIRSTLQFNNNTEGLEGKLAIFTGYDVKVGCESGCTYDSFHESKPALVCSVCGGHYDAERKEGKPVIYVASSGDDANMALLSSQPVKGIEVAFEQLAKWKQGGYIVITNGSSSIYGTNATISGSAVSNVALADCGGTVVIDGKYSTKTNATLTSYATLVRFNSDVELRNIELPAVNNPKVFALNYHSFIATENCSNAGTHYNYTIITGACFGSNPTGSYFRADRDAVKGTSNTPKNYDQIVSIDGFKIQNLLVGTKTAPLTDVTEYTYSCNFDQYAGGTTKIYLGENARVDSVNMRTLYYNGTTVGNSTYYGPTAYLYIDSAVIAGRAIKFVKTDASSAPATRERDTDEASNENRNMFLTSDLIIYTDECNLATMQEHVQIVNSSIFGDTVSYQHKDFEDGNVGVRVSYTTGDDFAGWTDENGLVEFGILMTAQGNEANLGYISEDHVNYVGKSVNYYGEDNANDKIRLYEYAGPEADVKSVTFRASLKYVKGDGVTPDTDHNEMYFVARPYAVITAAKDADIDGSVAVSYAVLGNISDAFNYETYKPAVEE